MSRSWRRKRASFLAKHPRLGTYLKKVQFTFWKRKVDFRLRLHGVRIDSTRILWVDPRKITDVVLGLEGEGYRKLNEFGRIVGGDWDLNTMPFEDLAVYQSFKARFIHGARWEETSHYREILDKLARGETRFLWGIRSEDDLNKRLGRLDHLFEEIKKHGYQTQQQLLDDNCSLRTLDEVTVRIGRNGEFLFEDGRHRLAIAKVLGLPRIPVMVTWRHKEIKGNVPDSVDLEN